MISRVSTVPPGAWGADDTGMRHMPVATTLAAITAGLTVAVALHRRTAGRSPATVPAPATATPVTPAASSPVIPVLDREGVVVPFVRPIVTATVAEKPAAPARCGDSGGRTKAGEPCAARATRGGRCHHHPLAA
jgi:hypothetical protein